jgi:hypothetical protein
MSETVPSPTTLPWIESPFFEELLAARRLTPHEKSLCCRYRQDGYLALDENILDPTEVRLADEYVVRHFDPAAGRIVDAWRHCPAIRSIAVHDRVLDVLRMLYGREPVPFQTINFLTGTEQATHSDYIHFSSLPSRFMCGVWVALEDITLAQGPLHYYPGSQRLPEYDYYDLGIAEEHLHPEDPYRGPLNWNNPRTMEKYRCYEELIARIARAHDLKQLQFEVKKGQLLVWSSNLLHGGSRIAERTSTRRSQVTHYYFQDTIPIIPMLSNPKAGDYLLRETIDIRTEKPMKRSFDGLPYEVLPSVIPGRSRIAIGVPRTPATEEERARAYFERYPDVAESDYGRSLDGARRHFELAGRGEGRTF